MKLTKCPEGHGYDAEKFDSCPICARTKDGARKAKVVKVKAVKHSKPAAQPEVKPAPAPVKEEKKTSGYTKPIMTIEDSPVKKTSKRSLYENEMIFDADFRPVEEHYKPNDVKADDIKQALAKNKTQKAAEPIATKTDAKPKEVKKEPEKKPAPEQTKPKVNISQFAKEAGSKPVKNEILPEGVKEHDAGGVKINYSEFKPGQSRAPLARDLKTDAVKPVAESRFGHKKPTDFGAQLDDATEKPSKKSGKNDKMHYSSERIAELYKDQDIERDETARIDDVNNMALGKDGTLLIKYIGTNEVVKIPSNITTIGKYAFRGNESAKRIIMSDSVKVVDKFAFAHCVHLEEIVFSKNLETIGENAFLKCQRVKELDLPNSLKSIGKGAFGR
ncbi:MAG: leucine-rich repeat domain-containing protein, partial [Ruminococcus sp.]|nr:leucine-rich repeat domain-containing protein [Ruminococcus sp.]